VKMDLRDFANELSMDSPAPGGGSVSALAGALSSALVSMVANLTTGKSGYEQVKDVMIDTAVNAQLLKDDLLKLIDKDTNAFNALMEAMRLPKKTDPEIENRQKAIEEASKQATLVPLEVMKQSLTVLELIKKIAATGNKNAISDAGVAALMSLASIKGASLNVKINLPSIEDESFKQIIAIEMDMITQNAQAMYDEIMQTVNTRMHPDE